MTFPKRKPARAILFQSIGFVASLLIATGCEFYHEKGSPQADVAVPTVKTVAYRHVQNIVSTRCVRCHSNEFSSYDSLRTHISDIQKRAIEKRDMPPNSPLSDAEAQTLNIWIQANMPLNAGEGSQPIPPPAPLEPTFQSIRDNVFTARCIVCHGPGGSHKKINIFDEALLTSSDGWVVPYDPDKSELYQDLIKPAKGRMPPAKNGAAPLSQEQIDTIRTWILNGAKD